MPAALGPLDHRIRIERPPAGRDPDYGTPSGAWTKVCEVWASMQDVLPSKGVGTEQQARGLATSHRATRVRMPYVPGIDATMRVVDLTRGGEMLQISTHIAELGIKDGLEFMASEFSTSGSAR